MAFANDTEFQDDFRRVGTDVTASFDQPGAPASSTEHASSQNLDVFAKADTLDEDDDLEDDDLDEDEEDDDEELEDDDLEDDDLDEEEDDEDEDLEDDEDDLDDEDEDDDEEFEDDDDTVKARADQA